MGILSNLFKKKEKKLITEEEMNTKVYDVVESVIDYNKTIDELREYYNEQINLIDKNDETIEHTELGMLQNMLKFMENCKNLFNKELTLDIEMLEEFDLIVGTLDLGYRFFGYYSEEDYQKLFNQSVAYFGILIIKEHGGNWGYSDIGHALSINGTNAFVNYHINRRIGYDESLVTYYNELKNQLEV